MMAKAQRDNNFDALRLLAAWFVLFSHSYPLGGAGEADPFVRWVGLDTLGGVGVCIFFVLSGYLVTQSWLRASGLAGFAWRRARRIYPALVVCVAVCTLLLGPLLTSLPVRDYFAHPQTLAYAKTASAWSIQYVLPGVFSGNPLPNAVNGSLWSLPYEIRCYLALAIIALLPFSLRIKTLVACAVLLGLVLLRPAALEATPFVPHLGLDYYYSKLGLIFAIGAAFATWQDTLQPRWWWGLSCLAAAAWLPAAYVAPRTALYAAGIAMLALGLALHPTWRVRLPERMGDWSYGVYLYGFPVQQTLAMAGLHRIGGFAIYLVLSTLCTAALAACSWHWVERPWLRSRRNR